MLGFAIWNGTRALAPPPAVVGAHNVDGVKPAGGQSPITAPPKVGEGSGKPVETPAVPAVEKILNSSEDQLAMGADPFNPLSASMKRTMQGAQAPVILPQNSPVTAPPIAGPLPAFPGSTPPTADKGAPLMVAAKEPERLPHPSP